MTFWILLVLATILTYFSLRYRSIVFSLACVLSWLGLSLYNLTTPPVGVTVGSTIHSVLIYTFLVMAGGIMVVYINNRRRGYTGYERTASEQAAYNRELTNVPTRSNIMSLTEDEYRARARNRMRARRI